MTQPITTMADVLAASRQREQQRIADRSACIECERREWEQARDYSREYQKFRNERAAKINEELKG
jgi:hypothetical protein